MAGAKPRTSVATDRSSAHTSGMWSIKNVIETFWPVIGGYPPRTDVRTNTSVWKTGDDFWKDYYATGFNTFTQGWCGSGRDQGYGQMLDYLQKELGTGILPILNVGNTQQVYHGTNAQAKADQAGILAKTFANESFLAYCEHGRPVDMVENFGVFGCRCLT
eukprot:COSAG02_NODE_15881_length_1133_cov_1.630561_1_plen_160_part_10